MIGRGLFVLTILSSCVLALPLTPSQLENEDVKVMKCIVEVLADVLSRPRPIAVSQECLLTLKTDDRLVSLLRHRNFLKELQEIAVQGDEERAQLLQRAASTPDPTTQSPRTAGGVADRSMLEALGGPGERSILSQKRKTEGTDKEEEEDERLGDEGSQEDSDLGEEVPVKRENEEQPGSRVSADESREGRDEKGEEEEEEEEEEYEEKTANSEEKSEENMTTDKKDAGFGEKRNSPRNKSKEKKNDDTEGTDKRFFSHKHEEKQEEEEDEGEPERGSRESPKPKRGKAMHLKRKAAEKEAQQLHSQQEVPHHSKEVSGDEEEEEEKKKRSPEERQLQMIARRGAEEKTAMEEEGSASRKSEEPEIESLAAIESELENVAQKLHELRRG